MQKSILPPPFSLWNGVRLQKVGVCDTPLCLFHMSVVCEVQNVGWFCLTVSVCCCEMQKVGCGGVCVSARSADFSTNSKSFHPTAVLGQLLAFHCKSLEMNPNPN